MTEQELKKIESEAEKFITKLQNAHKRELDTRVNVTETTTKVAVKLTLGEGHRELDLENAKYIKNKFKKKVRALGNLVVKHDSVNGDWIIAVSMEVDAKFNTVQDINNLAEMGKTIINLAEKRLTEPDILNAIDADCEPWFRNDENDAHWDAAKELEEVMEDEREVSEESTY